MRIEKNGEAIVDLNGWYRLAPPQNPVKQWVDGRSAKETARAWLENAPESPPREIALLLATHQDIRDLVIDRVEPEARIAFDDRNGPRNADLAIVARDKHGAAAISVEAKADESFGDTVAACLPATRSHGSEAPFLLGRSTSAKHLGMPGPEFAL
jgi:hypothetical protein